MVFLKALCLLILNTGLGWLLVFAIKAFFFYPKKPLYLGKKRIPFTPGYLYKKHDLYMGKLHKWIEEFWTAINDENNADTYIFKWEQKAYDFVWEKLDALNKIKYLPGVIVFNIRKFVALLIFEIVKQFFRNFVPYMAEKYEIQLKIDEICSKINVDTILVFFNRYVYKYLWFLFVGFATLVGFYNFILFLILH